MVTEDALGQVMREIQELRDELQLLRDVQEIRQLKARYFRFVDAQDWSAMGEEVLADDVHFELFGTARTGKSEVISFVSGSMAGASSFHHGHNAEITITGPDTAIGLWALWDHTKMPENSPTSEFIGCGHYRDEYVRTDRGWRVKSSILDFP